MGKSLTRLESTCLNIDENTKRIEIKFDKFADDIYPRLNKVEKKCEIVEFLEREVDNLKNAVNQ